MGVEHTEAWSQNRVAKQHIVVITFWVLRQVSAVAHVSYPPLELDI